MAEGGERRCGYKGGLVGWLVAKVCGRAFSAGCGSWVDKLCPNVLLNTWDATLLGTLVKYTISVTRNALDLGSEDGGAGAGLVTCE